jgi:hypothetical protein
MRIDLTGMVCVMLNDGHQLSMAHGWSIGRFSPLHDADWSSGDVGGGGAAAAQSFWCCATIMLTWKRIALILVSSSAIYKSPAGTVRRQGWIIKHFAV